MDPLKDFEKEYDQLVKAHQTSTDLSREYDASLKQMHELQQKLLSAQKKETKQAKELEQTLKSLQIENKISQERAATCKATFAEISGEWKKRLAKLPKPHNWFLNYFIGKTFNTVIFNRSDKLNFKKEYEAYKLGANKLSAVVVAIILFTGWRPLLSFYHFQLLQYYISVTIRENILRNNGSEIKYWWITHHYISIGLCCALLTWSYGDSYYAFRDQFLYYALYTVFLQYLQHQYQTKRVYELVAMEKADQMTVVCTDAPQMIWAPSMVMLLPFLLIGQIFQFYNGVTLLGIYFDHTSEIQILVSGLFFLVLSLGNLSTTLLTYYQKMLQKKQD